MPGRTLLEDQQYTIETPEHVEIVYTVAGPGSRLLATIIDFLIMLVPAVLAVLLVIFVLVTVVASETLKEMFESSGGPQDELVVWLAMAFFSLVQFALMWFYFVVFEVAWNGQSPGKRLLHIRVIRDGGQPVGLYTSMIRNLIRLVDFMPLFYLVGFVTMLASRHWRRLGDLAAGTLVVLEDASAGGEVSESNVTASLRVEVGAAWPPEPSRDVDPLIAEQFEEANLTRLDPAFFELAERFLDRRWQLEHHVTLHLAEKIARPAMERTGIVDLDPQRFLEQAVAYRNRRG